MDDIMEAIGLTPDDAKEKTHQKFSPTSLRLKGFRRVSTARMPSQIFLSFIKRRSRRLGCNPHAIFDEDGGADG